MDFDRICEAAGGILAFVELSGQILSSSGAVQNDPSTHQQLDFKVTEEEFIKVQHLLSHAISKPNAPIEHHSTDALLILKELATSSLEDIGLVLEEIKRITWSQKDNEESERAISNLLASPLVRSTLQQGKLERLSKIASQQISAIIRWVMRRVDRDRHLDTDSWQRTRTEQMRRTIEARGTDSRRIRPENESRIDSLSQELASLHLLLQKGSNNHDPGSRTAILSQRDVIEMRSILRQLTQAEDDMIADKIVASLNYDSRPVRHDSVPQAHKDTFRWAFESQLAEWFRSGSSTFWISGKPGSGKSTFMKFISSHQQTKDLLSSWAGSSDKLAIAAHFFWIAGTSIQKSWQGLFQSLLFDTFNKQPAVIRLICPRRWAAAQSGTWQEATEPWSVTELGVALRALATAPDFPLKLCFFIDGLDEYDSNHEELCNILHDMARSPHIKMCLSSRPWPVFEQRFGTDHTRRMDIHELTRDDIRKFVHDQLQLSNGSEVQMTENDRQDICQEIASKADGVFLWAFFVTKTLREASSRGDTISDLQQNLEKLPRDLEQLFRTMLESVHISSHAKMAGILQAASHALEPLHVDLYAVLEKEFDTPNYARTCPIQGIAQDQLSRQREQTTQSVHDKTKGLLKLVDQRFEFLHRTVKDFVRTRDMVEYLKEKLPMDYNGYRAIATAYLGFLKTTSLNNSLIAGVVKLGQGRNSGVFTSHLNRALIYTSEALKTDQSPESMRLLDEYGRAVETMIRVRHVTVRGIVAEGSDPRALFREELLRHNLSPYLIQRLRENPDFLEPLQDPPLYFALMPMSLSSGESPAPVPEILEILLHRGENPNLSAKRRPHDSSAVPSPWVLFAREIMSVFNMLSVACTFPALRFNDSLDKDIFILLLSHGADPNTSLLPERPCGSHTPFSHFLEISLSQFLGNECYDGYLRTLRVFLRAGSSLGIPIFGKTTTDDGEEMAFGNLARDRPEESILTSFCTALKTLFPSLPADPQRTKFVQSVVAELISHNSGKVEELKEIDSVLSDGCPDRMREELQSMIDEEMVARKRLKRDRGSWDETSLESAVKFSRF
jgi:hypothetical protein